MGKARDRAERALSLMRTRMHIVVTVHRLAGGLYVVVADFPGGEAGEEVGGQIQALLAHHVLVGDNAIGLENFVGHIAELGPHSRLVVFNGRGLSAKGLHGRAFQGVPARQERNLGLLAFGEYVVGALSHEIAVNHHIGHAAGRKEFLEFILVLDGLPGDDGSDGFQPAALHIFRIFIQTLCKNTENMQTSK